MAERLKVRRLGGKHWAWCVEGRSGRILPAHGWLARFHTHAEAIAYADRMARTNQGENND